eukprot:c24990_g1_i1 orf=43-1032(+)
MEGPPQQVGDAMELNAPSEAWDLWLNEELKLDSESPMDISSSLWNDFAQSNESVARSLFVCGPQVKDASLLGKQDSPQTSSSWHDPNIAPEGMLHLLTDEHGNSSPCLSDSFEGCNGSFVNACEDLPCSTNSMWLMPNEDSSPHDEVVEQSAESWMAGCFIDSNVHSRQQGSFQVHANPINVTAPKVLQTNAPGIPCRSQHARRGVRPSEEFLTSQSGVNAKKFAGPREKQTSRHTLVRSTSDMQITQPSPKPIVYPFALVKPCGIKGDATLKDINQRINMASPSQSSFKQSNTPSPSATSPFSGKPVLAVTKIHTEGKGTITIMRTRS